MAKRVPAPPKRRTVKRLPRPQVQPGAIGYTLSSDPGDGMATAADTTADQTADDEAKAEKRRQFLATARRRFKMSAEAEAELRRDMLEDMRFYNSEQWPDQIKANRILDNRVSLTINRLPQFVRQVVNQARQSKPSIQVNPVDNNADPETAEVFQGICRQIERQSKAQVAYCTASEHQAIVGRGWWRLVADYASDDSMEQEIRIRRILDSFSVYPDPATVEPDGSDATFGFIIERPNKDVYDAQYGHLGEPHSALDFQSIGDDAPLWATSDTVQVAEYFYIELVRTKLALVQFSAGQAAPVTVTVSRDSIKPEDVQPGPNGEPPKIKILKERETVRRQVKWALINGVDILDGNADRTAGRDLPGSYIPLIPVLGEELIVNGRRNLRGMVRDAISPQRAYNFWISSITEKIALGTKAPIIAALGQLEGLEEKWNNANVRNYPYLEYNAVDVNGTLVPPPQRATFDPDISAALQMTMQADRDLKSVIGMFDAAQERSPEQSGKAILARQRQGEEGTSHFLDNLSRAIEHTGRILVEWIPVYYDTPRMLRILGLDDQPKHVLVHAGQEQAAQDLLGRVDEDVRNSIMSGAPFDLSVGRYDVSISVGPSYQSRRQESVEALISLIQAEPQVLPWVADVLVENMDWPGARQLANRLKKLVPAEARDEEDGKPPIPPEVQQQLAQMQQQLQAALAALGEKDQIIQSKAQELAAKGQIAKMELDSKERLEQMRLLAEARQQQVEIEAKKSIELLNAQVQEIGKRLDHAHAEKLASQPDMGRHPSEAINYKDAPPDIRRQMEEQAGMTPSTAKEESPAAPQPKTPPAKKGSGGPSASAGGAE